MSAPQRWAAGALILLAVLAGAWWHGHRAGAAGVQTEWDRSALAAERQHTTDLIAARDEERAHARALANIENRYLEQQAHAESENATLRRQLRTGAVRLSVPVLAGSCRLPAAEPGPGSGDAAARAELSPTAADDLVALADDADAVVRQLGACQAVILADRQKLVPATSNSSQLVE